MADNKKFLEFYRLLENYKKLKKDQSVYKLSEEEIKKINSIVYDFTLNFKTEKSPLGFGLGALTGKAEDLANMERWSKGLVKALGLDNLDMTNPEDIKKAQAYLGHAIETTKGEEYAEQITGKGIKPNETDTELEDMMEDRSFNEFNLFRINKIPVRTKGGFGVDNIVRKLKTEENKEFLQFFKKKGKIDLTDEKSLVNLLSELTPDLKKEYITTGNINIDNAVKNIEKQEFSHPNLDITLEQITERFQGGDPTIPLNIDAINALDVKPAIDLIINNKLPLTDEAKAEYILNSLWVNFMKKGEYNPPHDHSDYLSFVIFLKVPEEITKEQEDFVGNSAGPGSLSFLYGEGNRQSITYQSVKPKERDIFIFPAWIKHYVAPFYSDVTRISVSGNIIDSVKISQVRVAN